MTNPRCDSKTRRGPNLIQCRAESVAFWRLHRTDGFFADETHNLCEGHIAEYTRIAHGVFRADTFEITTTDHDEDTLADRADWAFATR